MKSYHFESSSKALAMALFFSIRNIIAVRILWDISPCKPKKKKKEKEKINISILTVHCWKSDHVTNLLQKDFIIIQSRAESLQCCLEALSIEAHAHIWNPLDWLGRCRQ